jgi:hypothetical protein
MPTTCGVDASSHVMSLARRTERQPRDERPSLFESSEFQKSVIAERLRPVVGGN